MDPLSSSPPREPAPSSPIEGGARQRRRKRPASPRTPLEPRDAPLSSGVGPRSPLLTPSSRIVPRTPSVATPTRPRSGGLSPGPSSDRLRGDRDRADRSERGERGDVRTRPGYAVARGEVDGESERKEIYGTSINVTETMRDFKTFFDTFVDPNTGHVMYPRLVREAIDTNRFNINLNCRNLFAYSQKLYYQLVMYPQEIIPIFDMVVDEYKREEFPDVSDISKIQVKPFNLLSTKNMRELNPEDLDSLVTIKGMVIRLSEIIPEMKIAHFRCQICNNTENVVIEDGAVNEPQKCRNCQTKDCMQLIHNLGVFADKQLVKVQETPDSIPEGETPHTVSIFVFDALVDVAKPGDRVEITGIYRGAPVRVNPRMRTVRTVQRTYIDAVHFKKTDDKRIGSEDIRAQPGSESYTSFDETDLTQNIVEERERELEELGRDPDIYNRLTKSFAPNIWEMDNEKKGILCLLFGGTNSEKGAGAGRFRGELNVLLCGDPGTAKSQLLQYVHKIAPRGIYTSGKGSSAVGLTASIAKDPDSGDHVLESGALVLSDRGVCCIDEFDKMSDSTRSILHEVMEQQTVSIAKAGIVCTLNARTSILASANPKESRYNPNMSVVKNIQLGPTLLSRFDLIYLVLDKPNEHLDRKLGTHLISLYYKEEEAERRAREREAAGVISPEVLTRYIAFARRKVHPVLTDEASDLLVNTYTAMRKMGHSAGRKVVSATPRQLESLIRISEALARMRLSTLVERQDVMEADRLMTVATARAATDPKTGKIDMDLLATGVSAADRSLQEERGQILIDILTAAGSMRATAMLEAFNEEVTRRAQADRSLVATKVTMSEFQEVVDSLIETGKLQRRGKGGDQYSLTA